MCGYCIEYNTFTAIYNAHSGQSTNLDPNGIELIGYLQDLPDVQSILANLPADMADDGTLSSIIACRGLEILMAQGFDSAAYQSLLKTPAYLSALEVFTSAGDAENPLPADPRFDLSAAYWVWDKSTYFEPGYLDRQLRLWTLPDAMSLLKQYVDFRLQGIGLHRNDLEERMRQTGVFDPIEDITADDREAFDAHFPAFWCALHWLAMQPEGAPCLWEVISHEPIGVPEFAGLDLWFQRRAALLAYDRFGFVPFLKDLSPVRTELFQFIGLMRQITSEERASLLEALQQLEAPEPKGMYFNLRQWLETGDLQLS
ncbi:MAG: hypothetical protein Q8Q28_08960 [Pseudomonadota bacterium]|nr:hypothetical protein [Pseudomonadota bacterium]